MSNRSPETENSNYETIEYLLVLFSVISFCLGMGLYLYLEL